MKFDEVMDYVQYFLDYKKEKGASKPQTRITIIEMEPTVDSIVVIKSSNEQAQLREWRAAESPSSAVLC